MPTTTASPNMSLPVPVVGQDLGPQYAIDINSCLSILDAHDHSSGDGVNISQAGINISGDFALNGFNATLLRTARFSSQGAALAVATDLNCAYVVSNDLYFNDGLGNQIRMTQSGGVAGTPGSIAGLAAPASATYIPASTKFVWQSAVNVAAIMDMGSIILRPATVSAFGVTISAPSALAANYALELPGSLPSIKKTISVNSSGVMTADNLSSFSDVQNLSITASVASNALTIAVKTFAGSDASASDIANIGFRSATATSGVYTTRAITGALSLVIPASTTIGTTSATSTYIYVYAMDNGGTVVLACSLTLFDEKVVQSSSAISGGASASTLYSTAAQSNLPIRLIARLTASEATAGTWATSPSAVVLTSDKKSAGNYVESSVITSFTTTSASFTDVSNSTVTITTSGGRLFFGLKPSGVSGNAANVSLTSSGTHTLIEGRLRLMRDAVDTGNEYFLANGNASTSSSTSIYVPAGCVVFHDAPIAGTYVYKIQANVVASSTIGVSSCKFFVYEL